MMTPGSRAARNECWERQNKQLQTQHQRRTLIALDLTITTTYTSHPFYSSEKINTNNIPCRNTSPASVASPSPSCPPAPQPVLPASTPLADSYVHILLILVSPSANPQRSLPWASTSSSMRPYTAKPRTPARSTSSSSTGCLSSAPY